MTDRKISLPEGVSLETRRQVEAVCPNCSARGLNILYSIDDIPGHSCLLFSSRNEALNYPRGNLQLGYCGKCGFLTNTCFNPAMHEYSARYEETQGFSAHFNAFAKTLARKLIDQYDIRNKTILEIGCGKGEFLALICELGDNRGIGIDPAYVPQRNPDAGGARVEFIADFYGPKYTSLRADVVCCRHTLEHIPDTGYFMKKLRRTIGDRPDTLVIFEVPDVMRVLREGAFWDIYYEHCSYFSAGSLARLFRSAGFSIDSLYLDYGDQYLILTARPSMGPTQGSLDLETDLEALNNACSQFTRACSEGIDYWQRAIGKIVQRGQKVVVWGSGSKGVAFLTTVGLKNGGAVEYVVDINPYRQGKYMPGTGQLIVSPEFLAEYLPDYVIVMNPVYCDEIGRDLERYGVSAGLLPVDGRRDI